MIRIRGISSAADEVHRRRFVSRQSQQIHRLIPTPCPMTSSMHKHEMRRLRHPHNNNIFLSFFFFFWFPPHSLQQDSICTSYKTLPLISPRKSRSTKKLKVPETNKILELLMTLNLWIESPTLPPSAPSLLSVYLSHTQLWIPLCELALFSLLLSQLWILVSLSYLISLSLSPNCGFLSP
jgi:hypothetical protein